MHSLEIFNRALFIWINADDETPLIFVKIAQIFAVYLIYLIPILLVSLFLWGSRRIRQAALLALIVTVVALLINQCIGFLYFHPRPFMNNDGFTWLSHAPETSFPSDHMTVFMAVAVSLIFDGVSRAGLITLLFGIVVGWSRVFLGVHYPFDMLGSIGVAAISYLIVHPFWTQMAPATLQLYDRLYHGFIGKRIVHEYGKDINEQNVRKKQSDPSP